MHASPRVCAAPSAKPRPGARAGRESRIRAEPPFRPIRGGRYCERTVEELDRVGSIRVCPRPGKEPGLRLEERISVPLECRIWRARCSRPRWHSPRRRGHAHGPRRTWRARCAPRRTALRAAAGRSSPAGARAGRATRADARARGSGTRRSCRGSGSRRPARAASGARARSTAAGWTGRVFGSDSAGPSSTRSELFDGVLRVGKELEPGSARPERLDSFIPALLLGSRGEDDVVGTVEHHPRAPA